MNKTIYNLLICLFIIIIIYNLFSGNQDKEGFVPKFLKSSYRPIERNVRMKYEGFLNKISGTTSNLFRKIGIL